MKKKDKVGSKMAKIWKKMLQKNGQKPQNCIKLNFELAINI